MPRGRRPPGQTRNECAEDAYLPNRTVVCVHGGEPNRRIARDPAGAKRFISLRSKRFTRLYTRRCIIRLVYTRTRYIRHLLPPWLLSLISIVYTAKSPYKRTPFRALRAPLASSAHGGKTAVPGSAIRGITATQPIEPGDVFLTGKGHAECLIHV